MAYKSERSLPYHLIYLAEACKLATYLTAHKSQHLHAHFGTNSAEIAMLASQLSGVPYSFTAHGPEEFDKPVAIQLKTTINFAKFVVAISSFGRSQLFRWANYADWEKIKIVHCGLEATFYNLASAPMPTRPRMICVGRLCEQKGQLLLIEAAKQLVDGNIDFELVLAGDGEMRSDIEGLIKKYGLQQHISITGWISSQQVRDLILGAQLLVLPSFAEGLPVVIMEAMSLRRPVLSTYVAGIPELVQHGKNGWLCAAGDADELANSMRDALKTPLDSLKIMGEEAYKRVVLRHDIDIEAAKLAGHIKHAVHDY